MWSAHVFFRHMPNWAGFCLLIVAWMLLRGFLLRARGRAMQRMRMGQSMPPPMPQVQIQCPRCSAGAPAIASFCPHCGLSLTNLPPAIPQGQLVQRRQRSGLLMLIWILLGVIGLAAYVFWRFGSEDQTPASSEPPHVRIHQYHR